MDFRIWGIFGMLAKGSVIPCMTEHDSILCSILLTHDVAQ